MNCRYMILVMLLIFGVSTVLVRTAIGQTRLGLHVTQEELNIWRQRAVSGPYKTAGDVSTNSPSDWTRIQNNGNNFLNGAHPGYQQWAGQTTNNCYPLTGAGAGPGRSQGDPIRDAAFVYLVTGTTSYRDAVRTELLAQAAVAGTNFSNRTRWCTTAPDDSDNIFSVANWLTKLLFAYDYTRPSLSASDKATLDTWFLNAGTYLQTLTDSLILPAFPNRNSDDYSNPTDAGLTACVKILYYGGPSNNCWGEFWNNRDATMVRYFTLAGILLDNTFLKNQGKRYFKEWMQYNVFYDGGRCTPGEFYRWLPDYPGLGWDYASLIIGSQITIADALARIGDRELYDYTTSNGRNGTAGGPKNLHCVLTNWHQYVDHTLLRYGTDQAGNNGNVTYRIDSIDGLSQQVPRVDDTGVVQANVYYRDNYIKTVYMRTASGSPAYPSTPAGSGWQVWGGEWGIYPGTLFMFGQMEGVVNPYGGTTTIPLPSSPAVTVDSTYPGYTIPPINDGVVNAAGGTATTWASAESTTADHWINIGLPSSQQINTATIYWAYNSNQQKYMTSQRVDVQFWNGSSYVTTASITYPGSDIPSSTVSFPAVTTSQVRFYQPANQGNPTYPGVFWITEVSYAYQPPSAPKPPSAPTALQISITP